MHSIGDVRRTVRPGRRREPRRARLVFVVLVYCLISVGIAGAVTHRLQHTTAAAPPGGSIPSPRPAKYLVLIVLDGARPDYFNLTRMPHVDALRATGAQFTNAFDGILESETPAGHTTISTGSPPSRDGILGFGWAQNDNDFSLFSPTVVRAGAIEHIMEAANVPTIAGLYKAKFPRARVVALSGHKYYAADPLGGPSADAIMYYQGNDRGKYVPVAIPGHMPPKGILNAPGVIGPSTHLPDGGEDRLATNLALRAFQVMHQRITLINYPEFDWPIGHVDGGILARSKVIALMKEFDRDLARIEHAYAKVGVLKRTLFVITADHGMEPIHRFVDHAVFWNAIRAAGTTAPDISYNTATYIWLRDASRARAVADGIMRANDPGIESTYYLDTLHGVPHYVRADGTYLGKGMDAANQYLLGTLMNGHQPSVVAFCKAGSTSTPDTSHWKADHGGAGWQSQHIPLIFSGPMIRSGTVVTTPAQLEDVATTALTAMGVRPTGMAGHVLSNILTRSTPAQRTERAQEVKTLNPIVDALIAQNSVETGS
jgi:hypothetical protein